MTCKHYYYNDHVFNFLFKTDFHIFLGSIMLKMKGWYNCLHTMKFLIIIIF